MCNVSFLDLFPFYYLSIYSAVLYSLLKLLAFHFVDKKCCLFLKIHVLLIELQKVQTECQFQREVFPGNSFDKDQ